MKIQQGKRVPDRGACAGGKTGAVIAVTGLSFESRIAGGSTIISDGVLTPSILDGAIRGGVRGIISFGVCGGLDPALRPGQCVIGSSVLSGDEIHHTDEAWSTRLVAGFPGAKHAVVAGMDAPITDTRERLRLHARTGAVVADMESHLVAKMASAHKLPFAICRVVLNPAHRKLPPAALLQLQQGGMPDLKGILRSVLKQPGQMQHLARLAVDASIAVFALRRGKLLVGANLGFPHP